FAMLPAAMVAALTDSFARALLWSVALVAAGLFVMTAFTSVGTSTLGPEVGMTFVGRRMAALFGMLAVEMAVIAAVQFFVRHRGWWLMAAGGAMAITVAATALWRFEINT